MSTTTRRTLACSMLVFAGVLAIPAKKMTKQFLNVDGQKPPGYTHVVTSPPGKMIFISGRGGAGADGKLPADFGSQVKNPLEDHGTEADSLPIPEHGKPAGGYAGTGRAAGRVFGGNRGGRDRSGVVKR